MFLILFPGLILLTYLVFYSPFGGYLYFLKLHLLDFPKCLFYPPKHLKTTLHWRNFDCYIDVHSGWVWVGAFPFVSHKWHFVPTNSSLKSGQSRLGLVIAHPICTFKDTENVVVLISILLWPQIFVKNVHALNWSSHFSLELISRDDKVLLKLLFVTMPGLWILQLIDENGIS